MNIFGAKTTRKHLLTDYFSVIATIFFTLL